MSRLDSTHQFVRLGRLTVKTGGKLPPSIRLDTCFSKDFLKEESSLKMLQYRCER